MLTLSHTEESARKQRVQEIIQKSRKESAAVRKFFREHQGLRDYVAEFLPVEGDWSPTLVSEYISHVSDC